MYTKDSGAFRFYVGSSGIEKTRLIAEQEGHWISMWFGAVDNDTAMTAGNLNADYRVISQSGWGVLTAWDNNPYRNIPDIYEKVCGLIRSEMNEALGAYRSMISPKAQLVWAYGKIGIPVN